MRTPKLAVRVQFPFEWNIYLLFNSDIMNLVWKTRGGDRKHSLVNFCFFWGGCIILLILVLLGFVAQRITFLSRLLV